MKISKAQARSIGRLNRKNLIDKNIIEDAINNRIINSIDFIGAKDYLLYAATDDEIDLYKTLCWCIKEKRRVYFPIVTDCKECKMEFIKGDTKILWDMSDKELACCLKDKERVYELLGLKKGYMGIYEPIGQVKYNALDSCQAVMILPGLAFDKEGGRVGYGKGFYDRYIRRGFAGKKIAVSIDKNVFEKIDTDKYDISWDWLITEQQLYK